MITSMQLRKIMTERLGAMWYPHRSEWHFNHGDRVLFVEYFVLRPALGYLDPVVSRIVLQELDAGVPGVGIRGRKIAELECDTVDADRLTKFIATTLIDLDFDS